MNGKKCNSAKLSVRRGTFFDNSKLSIQSILRIVWNFIHHLSEEQCKHFVGISTKTNHTVSEYYGDCRNICNTWIWDPKNLPKLGGVGVIVEMDESYFPGQPKFNRGRRLGTTWEEDDKWVFGLTARESLDCIIVQVPSNRSRKSLLPIINKHCLDGTLFCSDGWKVYHCLAEHLDLEDVVHYPVSHSKNYVNPDTGTHTQTIEGLWSHVKDFLPVHGMKPCDLGSYLGWFMWTRYCKQRKLDEFIHFRKCVAEIRPPKYIQKLPTAKRDFTEVNIQQNSDDVADLKITTFAKPTVALTTHVNCARCRFSILDRNWINGFKLWGVCHGLWWHDRTSRHAAKCKYHQASTLQPIGKNDHFYLP
jgi:hypothetical protein